MTAELFANFAVVSLFVAIWALSQEWVRTWPPAVRLLGAGLFMGLGASASMELSVSMYEGIRFDLRSVLLALSGVFGGPLAAILAGVVAGGFRLVMGGAGALTGTVAIALAVAVGIVGYYARRRWGMTLPVMLWMSLVQAALPLFAIALLPNGPRQAEIQALLLQIMLLTGVASFFATVAIEYSRHRGWLTHLMKSAVAQAPDYFYVKDRSGRIVIANQAVADISGKVSISALTGLTDFELNDDGRAGDLFAAEQDILTHGGAIVDHEEQVTRPDGTVRTYVTTKRAIRNEDGTIAGLVGVTKDLTERLALERKLLEAQSDIDVILSEMSEGLARFDDDGRLAFCNENYRTLFPLSGQFRHPGTHIEDILRGVLATGEQHLGDLAGESWIAEVVDRMQAGGEEQVHMFDGRWLLVRTTPLRSGGAVVIVSDISDLKSAESKLMEVADQLRVLASTDPLTGLHNRRDFDSGLKAYFERGTLDQLNLGVIALDIDHFKAYNDTYGHPAGDACLRRVAAAIRDCVKRPSDMVARIGGEEFAVLLPHTDLAGTAKVAEDIRMAIEALAVPHSGSSAGIVSISAGIASTVPGNGAASTLDLVEMADKALYAAKAAGRNRVIAA